MKEVHKLWRHLDGAQPKVAGIEQRMAAYSAMVQSGIRLFE